MKTNTRVILICLLLSLPFTWYAYQKQKQEETTVEQASNESTTNSLKGNAYERAYSPNFGPDNAKVTIVEYFDPACGACRAFYPIVKEIQSRHPEDVRVVLRYATFHKGSDTIVRMLEAARLQGKFVEVLEALLIEQATWTENHVVNADKAWPIAEAAGLDISTAQSDMNSEEVDKRLLQETEDIRTLKVSKTPTFFVNEQALSKFGAAELYELVVSEINQP